jgi:membrane protease YdiL (CAAX protease family)
MFRSAVWVAFGFAVAATLTATFALGVGLSLLAQIWPAAGRSLLAAAVVEVGVYTALALALVRAFQSSTTPLSSAFGLTRVSPRLLLFGALLGLALHGPADFVEAVVEGFFPYPDAVLVARAERLLPPSSAERVGLFVLVAGFVPLIEELFFRGALFGILSRALAETSTLLVTSLCFTLSHAEPRSWPALSLVALVLGGLRAASGSLLPGILLHAGFNATTLAMIFAHPANAFARSAPSWPLASAGLLLCMGLSLGVWQQRAARAE